MISIDHVTIGRQGNTFWMTRAQYWWSNTASMWSLISYQFLISCYVNVYSCDLEDILAAASSFLYFKISSAGAKSLWHGGEWSLPTHSNQWDHNYLNITRYAFCCLFLSIIIHCLGEGDVGRIGGVINSKVTKCTVWQMVNVNFNLHRSLKWKLNWD